MTVKQMFVLAVLALFLMSCGEEVRREQKQVMPTGQLAYVKKYEGRADLDSLYKVVRVPLLVMNEQIYLPQVPCLDPRRFGAEDEKRNLGGETERRNLGGETEKRNLGGETEKRNLGGETEKRNLGGETEKRNLGGETEKRNLGGETEKRNLGGETEKRNLGGETENRNIGGETENRNFGGAIMQVQCSPLPGGNGFSLVNPPRIKIEVFDGIALREILNGVFEY